MEEWLLLVQVSRWGKPVWLEEDPPRSGQAKLETIAMIISTKKTSMRARLFLVIPCIVIELMVNINIPIINNFSTHFNLFLK